MNFKELTLASFAAALALSTGCVVDDPPAGDTDDGTDSATTMTTGPTGPTGPTTDPTTGPTTDPDTTDTDPTDDTDTDPTGDTDTDTDTDDIDPDLYDFREDEAEAYTRVDRNGFPAISTALIPEANRDAYNAASPTNDAAGDFLEDVDDSIGFLHDGGDSPGNGLNDELIFALTALNPELDPAEVEDLICDPLGLAAVDTCVAQAGQYVFPDVVRIDTGIGTGFPNGRGVEVPVIDIILAVLLLDVLDGDGKKKNLNFDRLMTFVDLDPAPEAPGEQGLSQSGNDVEFPAVFPYLAPAHE